MRRGAYCARRAEAVCTAGRYGDVVLWHYAFARHWFKINLAAGLTGRIAVYAVDLFADVLVRADGVAPAWRRAQGSGPPTLCRGALRGLDLGHRAAREPVRAVRCRSWIACSGTPGQGSWSARRRDRIPFTRSGTHPIAE